MLDDPNALLFIPESWNSRPAPTWKRPSINWTTPSWTDAASVWLKIVAPETVAMAAAAPVHPAVDRDPALVVVPDRAVPLTVVRSHEAAPSPRMDPNRQKNPARDRCKYASSQSLEHSQQPPLSLVGNVTPSPSHGPVRWSATSPVLGHAPSRIAAAAPSPRTTNLVPVRQDRSPAPGLDLGIGPIPRTSGTSPVRRHQKTMTTPRTGTTTATKIRRFVIVIGKVVSFEQESCDYKQIAMVRLLNTLACRIMLQNIHAYSLNWLLNVNILISKL